MPTLKESLKPYSRGELEQFLQQLLQNPIFKEHLCLVEERIKHMERSLLQTVTLNEEMQNQENFDKGRYQGLLNLVCAIEDVRNLIKEKDTR